jgi:hypothetical protein
MVVVAPRVIARDGPKAPVVVGLLLLAAGMVVMSLVRPDGNVAADMLPASLVPRRSHVHPQLGSVHIDMSNERTSTVERRAAAHTYTPAGYLPYSV